jgi:hypothetical protein
MAYSNPDERRAYAEGAQHARQGIPPSYLQNCDPALNRAYRKGYDTVSSQQRVGQLATMVQGSQQNNASGMAQAVMPAAGQATARRSPDTRFRSFAERFLIERLSRFDQEALEEDIWKCIMEAKNAYSKIRLISETLNDEDR